MQYILTEDIVLSLFDYTGIMVEPWANAGFKCYCVDLKHEGITRKDNIYYIGRDVKEFLPPLARYKIVFAFPPCTDLAVSGAAWFKDKGLGKLSKAIDLVHRAGRIAKWSKAPYMIENPVSTLSTYWRKPDYIFDPYEYGGYIPIEENYEQDGYTKKTCLWTGAGFVMPQIKPIENIQGSKMHYLFPSKDRAEIRARTPRGFARAVFEANRDNKNWVY